MKIVITLDISADSIDLNEVNSEDTLAELGREDEPFESKLEYLEFEAERLQDDELSFEDAINAFNAIVEVEASE
jgi:hypothetical protein